MKHITDEMVDRAISSSEAQIVLGKAYKSFALGHAAMQKRERTTAGAVKLSTLGAVLPHQGVAGAKVYTTINGKFSFVVVLFSTETGALIATLDANSLTRIRTAATTVLALEACKKNAGDVLGVIGLGVQGCEHLRQISDAFAFKEILVHDPYAKAQVFSDIQENLAVPVRQASADEIAQCSDTIVTATRSSVPLFRGDLLKEDAFVAAIGSSLPNTRELDDMAIQRAGQIIVEWRTQALEEAGDLVMAATGAIKEQNLIELGELLAETQKQTLPLQGLTLFKAVGVGMADIALAGAVFDKLYSTGQ